jgi:hypothetical protein
MFTVLKAVMKTTLFIPLIAFICMLACNPKEQPDDQPPILTLMPVDAAYVKGTIQLQGEIKDNSRVSSIKIFADGNLIYEGQDASVPLTIDTKILEDGLHTIEITAVDASGNSASKSVQINVLNYFFKFTVVPSYFYEDEAAAYIFISDKDGNVLGTKKVAEDALLKFETPDDFNLGDTLVVNVFNKTRLFNDYVEKQIYSYTAMRAGTYLLKPTLFFDDREPAGTHHIKINSEYLFVHISGEDVIDFSSSEQENIFETDVLLAKNNSNVFASFQHSGQAPRFAELENLNTDQTTILAIDTLQSMDLGLINADPSLTFYFNMTQGIREQNKYDLVWSEVLFGYDPNRDYSKLNFYYPGSAYSSYVFSGYYATPTEANSFGILGAQPPSDFPELDVSLKIFSFSDSKLSVEITGDADIDIVSVYANKSYTANNVFQANQWRVYFDPKSPVSVILPELPPEVEEFSFPAAKNMEFLAVENTDYHSVGGYEDFLRLQLVESSAFDVQEYKAKTFINANPSGRTGKLSPLELKMLKRKFQNGLINHYP